MIGMFHYSLFSLFTFRGWTTSSKLDQRVETLFLFFTDSW